MYEYIFINKNLLIPIIINEISIDKLLIMLMDQTLNKSNEYCKNIYIVLFYNRGGYEILFTNGKGKQYFIKKHNSDNIKSISINSSFGFNFINKFLNNNIMNEIEIESDNEEEINLDLSSKKNNELDIGLFTNTNLNKENYLKNNNINSDCKLDIGLFTKYETQEDTNVFNDCEKLMNRFYEEQIRKKNIKEQLMIDEKEEISLLKKKRDIIQDKIVELKGKYRTYCNIKKDMGDNINIPELFNIEFKYFENMNNEDKDILNNLDDNDIMNTDIYNECIIEMANNFKSYINERINSKESRFEHNWGELDNDIINS